MLTTVWDQSNLSGGHEVVKGLKVEVAGEKCAITRMDSSVLASALHVLITLQKPTPY